MKTPFLNNQIEIKAQNEIASALRDYYTSIESPHFNPDNISVQGLSSIATMDDVSDYIEDSKDREIAFQVAIAQNALEKASIAMSIVQAERALALQIGVSQQRDLNTCIGRDRAQANLLFEKAARSIFHAKQIEDVEQYLPHFIASYIPVIQDNWAILATKQIAPQLLDWDQKELIGEIGEQRLKLAAIVLQANHAHLQKIAMSLNLVTYFEKARSIDVLPDDAFLQGKIDSNMDYIPGALIKCDTRLSLVRSYMEAVYDMGDGRDQRLENFQPVVYNYAPIEILLNNTP